ncbi:MAG: putative acetyltransferase [Myxococcota bacterium]|jgi:putative acetyltransferase
MGFVPSFSRWTARVVRMRRLVGYLFGPPIVFVTLGVCMITTITIRRAAPTDAPEVAAIFSQPGAFSETLQLPHASESEWEKRLRPRNGHYMLVACALDEETDVEVIVGTLGLHTARHVRRRHAAEIGMAVHEDWTGKGIGSALLEEALETADAWFGLIRLELSVFIDNEAAVALYTKHGFEVEGCLQKYAFRDGRYEDVFTMARIVQPAGFDEEADEEDDAEDDDAEG